MRQHPYCYPGTNVYRNKYDVRDAKELEDLERDLSAYRLSHPLIFSGAKMQPEVGVMMRRVSHDEC